MKQLLWILILISSINHAQDMASSIAEGNIAALQALIKQGADVNALLEVEGEQVPPLRLAARTSSLELVKALVEAGADPNGDYSSPPLHVAAFRGNFDIVKYLLSKGAALSNSVTGWTVLHSAASGGHLELTDYLIAQGADVNAQDEDGQTSLMYAAEYPIPLAKLLISKGAELNPMDNSGETALDWANSTQTAKYLKILGVMKGDAIRQQLFSAVRAGDTQAVIALAAKGISMNILGGGYSPLTVAAIETQNPDMMKILYQLGANPSLDDTVFQASYRGLSQSVLTLVNMGAPLRNLKTGWTALHSAASGGHVDLVEWLIVEKGLDVNAQDEDGETPLMYAAGRPEGIGLLQLLLAKEADANLKDNGGKTAYDWAVEQGNTESAEYLKKLTVGIEKSAVLSNDEMARAIQEGNTKKIKDLAKKGFDLDAESFYDDYTLLEFAAYQGTLETVKTLINLGANPIIGSPVIIAAYRGEKDICEYLISQGSVFSTPTGWTALHAASSGGHSKIVEYLLAQGKDPNAQDEDGESPLMYASKKSLDTVKVLIKAGADPFLQDNKEQTALKWAMDNNQQNVISYFNTEYPSLRPLGGILSIILEGDVQILNEANLSEEDINKTYHYHDTRGACLGELTPLQIAGHVGNLEMIKALIELGADVSATNALGDTSSALAGQAGHAEVVKFFRTTYPDMYSKWDILQIIRSRDPQVLREANLPMDILSAKYHYHDENGDCFGELSLLQVAIVGGDLGMTEALAILGVDISENYPVMIAAYMGYTNITSYLMSQGSPLSVPEQGFTALHSAAEGGHVPMIEFLIAQKQDVNAINTSGQTPLMLASGANLDAVQALIKAHADVKLQDTNGRSALDYAIDNEKSDIVNYYNAKYPRIKPRAESLEETSAVK